MSTYKEHKTHFYESELDALLSNSRYEAAGLINKHQNDDDFWMQDFDTMNSLNTASPSNTSKVDPPTADLLGS
ncbi:hypothetical protein AC249_AIPGENE29123 [Exaiptasia diaphana]|nr:hypothetical protein AC249_AIPGENE29123 [Exaiptasia diaphana]